MKIISLVCTIVFLQGMAYAMNPKMPPFEKLLECSYGDLPEQGSQHVLFGGNNEEEDQGKRRKYDECTQDSSSNAKKPKMLNTEAQDLLNDTIEREQKTGTLVPQVQKPKSQMSSPMLLQHQDAGSNVDVANFLLGPTQEEKHHFSEQRKLQLEEKKQAVKKILDEVASGKTTKRKKTLLETIAPYFEGLDADEKFSLLSVDCMGKNSLYCVADAENIDLFARLIDGLSSERKCALLTMYNRKIAFVKAVKNGNFDLVRLFFKGLDSNQKCQVFKELGGDAFSVAAGNKEMFALLIEGLDVEHRFSLLCSVSILRPLAADKKFEQSKLLLNGLSADQKYVILQKERESRAAAVWHVQNSALITELFVGLSFKHKRNLFPFVLHRINSIEATLLFLKGLSKDERYALFDKTAVTVLRNAGYKSAKSGGGGDEAAGFKLLIEGLTSEQKYNVLTVKSRGKPRLQYLSSVPLDRNELLKDLFNDLCVDHICGLLKAKNSKNEITLHLLLAAGNRWANINLWNSLQVFLAPLCLRIKNDHCLHSAKCLLELLSMKDKAQKTVEDYVKGSPGVLKRLEEVKRGAQAVLDTRTQRLDRTVFKDLNHGHKVDTLFTWE